MNKSEYEREVTVRLFQASNALQILLDKMLKSEQLTAKQFFMMIVIGSFAHDPNISELSDAFKTSHQNVKQVLLKLKKNGFVRMYKDEDDGRITRVSFTKKAISFWASRDRDDEKKMQALYDGISIEHMDIVLNSLMTVMGNVERMDE